MEARTFREAYGILQDHAETLREQAEPNIDNLLSIVTESVAAYKVCKERIDAVEKALDAALTDVGGAAPGDDGAEPVAERTSTKTAAKNPSTGFDNMDDEIPF